MTTSRRLFFIVSLVSVSALTQPLAAETHVCSRCGADTCCRAVCRCVPGTEEKKKTCYDCKCEDYCIPGPSLWCGRKCEAVPYGDDSCGCSKGCCLSWNIWKPCGCAEVRTRKVLVAHEVKKEVPNYKWQVEYICDNCAECCADAMPYRPGQEGEILPVSAETPLEPAADSVAQPVKAAKKSWWSQLLSR